jgi:hypothetical protein
MKKRYTVLYILFFCCFTLQAEENIHERVFVHTDKDCYVAGEDILLKFLVINPNFQAATLSKVGYIEISDVERPYIQLKLALKAGCGAGKVKIPEDIPSGIYQLSAYTRFMRNESENVFFKRTIAIINVSNQTESDRMEIVKPGELAEIKEIKQEPSNIRLVIDRNEYAKRSPVQLSLDNLPENISDLVVSVSRNDSLVSLQKLNKEEWLKQVKTVSPISQSPQWLPEYEGHIVNGRIIPSPNPDEKVIPNISFVGKDIRYTNGRSVSGDGLSHFYTNEIFGHQQIVASLISILYEKTPYRLDIISPFAESLPKNLPPLQVRLQEEKMMERHIGAQLQKIIATDTLYNQSLPEDYYYLPAPLSYDLDEYTRFNTLSETIFEFINRVRVNKVDNKRKIRVFLPEEQSYNTGNTLVLLDGIPIYDHDLLLNYNPYLIKRINIYSGRYTFNGETYGSIVSFVTPQGNLPSFQLSEESQLFEYEFPILPEKFEMPDYSDETVKNSRKPDFRHTLYWNPFVEVQEGKPVQLSFYTSDLSGTFEILVEGITRDGKLIFGAAHFQVK